ncbi:MAG: FAD/NAD(P)-binding oxidoreductase [Burkholderiaceae bacterium]|nr:FAD/NAD(P)-binding oxidoreductase [Burkholderiaceae bacterium]
MQRRNFLAQASTLALSSGWLSACGGGGSTDTDTENNGTSSGTPTTSTNPVIRTPPGTAAKSRVIVVGGGMAGATAAKYLRLWGDMIDVTLVERQSSYTSCIMSSLVLSGQRSLSSLVYGYDTLRSRYGINVVLGDVTAIDPVGVKVMLASGQVLSADRIVLAPGIEFDAVPGLGTPDRMPHAWKAGTQTSLLASQLAAMPSGGTAILTIPKVPYRCPPGPYERACLLADWMKVNKPGSKLLVLDSNADFTAEKDNFSQAFYGLHANVIQYVTNADVTQVDPVAMTLNTTQGQFRGDVVNLIPRQRAGSLITANGLANATEGRFAGVDVLSYASTVSGAGKVHIIGDSSATTQPKAGHIANQEAKVCADAIVRLLAGGSPDPAPVTNSACYSTITMTQASWLTGVFQYHAASASMQAVAASSAASVGWSSGDFRDMGTWFNALMADTFA